MPKKKRTHRERDYWSLARHPLSSLVFLAPLLVIYELGVLLLSNGNPDALRNGADFWMRDWLQRAGIGHGVTLPLLVVAALMLWHVAGKYPWKVRADTLVGMSAESLLFALVLILFGQAHETVFAALGQPGATLTSLNTGSANRAIAFLGAGVYEEVMFRLLLLPVGYFALRACQCPQRTAAGCAILGTSLVFAMAHYIGPAADQFSVYTFSFRALAGGFFAALFVTRGFGITVGSHAAYDLLVGVLLIPDV